MRCTGALFIYSLLLQHVAEVRHTHKNYETRLLPCSDAFRESVGFIEKAGQLLNSAMSLASLSLHSLVITCS